MVQVGLMTSEEICFKFTDNDGPQVMAKAHSSLWIRQAKNNDNIFFFSQRSLTKQQGQLSQK